LGQETKSVKRRFPRVVLSKGMLIAWQHSGGRSVSRVATLGLGGLFIATPDPAPAGTLVKLVFDVPGGEVRARAIVKNVKAGQGMAVGFIQMGYADRARLGQLMKKLT
jgi:PilZ domain